MSKLVLVDSQIFIWGVKGDSSTHDAKNVEPAKRFIQSLSDMKYRLLMPTPQLGELLSYVPVAEQAKIRNLIDSRFIVVPFDDLAVGKFAELMHNSLTDPELRQYRDENKVPKNKLKFDCMLVAIAITRGATKIYSNDPDLKRYAQGQIPVEIMPHVPFQTSIFDIRTQ
jgi:predicted nucleic acid-binding protein